MTLIVSAKSGKQYPPVPEGLTQATCIDVIDLGERDTKFGKKQQVKFVFETPHQNPADGAPLLIYSFAYTTSLNEKANLRKDLERWRGRAFTPEELRAFDLEKLIGAGASLMVVHKTGDDGTVYSNIAGIFKAQGEKYVPMSDYVRVKDRPENSGKKKETHEDDEDAVPF